MDLLEFQSKSAEHIMRHFEQNNVYLLADETGLGKTYIAGEVMLKLAGEKTCGDFNVVYIASNLVLARNNAEKKLQIFNENNIEVVKADRLSMLWEVIEKGKTDKKKRIKIYPITPEVSLTQNTGGTDKERKGCKTKYYELVEDLKNTSPKENPKEIPEEIPEKIEDVICKIDGISKLINPYSKDSDPFFAHYKVKPSRYRKKGTAYKDIELTDANDARKTAFDIDDARKTAFDILMDMFINIQIRDCIYHDWDTPNDNYQKTYELICELLNKSECFQPDFAEWLSKQRDAYIHGLYSLNDILNEIWNVYTDNKDALFSRFCTDNCDYFNRFLEYILDLWRDRFIRTVMSYYSLQIIKPDLVIIDEIQNYPEIFSDKQPADERARSVKLVIDTLLNRSGHNNGKILMLSATPYAYKNAITIENDEGDSGELDELDKFVKHLVGLDDILKYMDSKEDQSNRIAEEWKACQRKLERLTKAKVVKEGEIDSLKDELEKLSKRMLEIGISRTERPTDSYKPQELALPNGELDPSEWMSFFFKNGRALKTRLALSLPRGIDPNSISGTYESLKGAKNTCPEAVSTRIKKLTDDLFEGDSYLWLFVPPNKPSRALNGVFKNWLPGRSWGKTLLFSAFSEVPYQLKKCIEAELDKKLEKYYADHHPGGNYEGDLGEIKEASKTKPGGNIAPGQDEELAKLLTEYFSAERAQRVLLAIYGKDRLQKEYWDCVKQYCKDGCFEDVLAEFNYMLTNSKKTPSEYLDQKAYTEYSTWYNGTNMKTEVLTKRLDEFNSPFYPFVFLLTSVAEEGLDFHWYADRIVHWNAPSSPIALLQREGRIDRILCMAIRKTAAQKFPNANGWEDVFTQLKETKLDPKYEEYKDLYPKFWAGPDAYRIKRYTYYYPESGEVERWNVLIKNLEYYRSMFGACENISLDLLSEKDKESFEKLKDLRINIKVK